MSHFTTIETQIRDIAALKAACAELGVVLEAGAQARGDITASNPQVDNLARLGRQVIVAV